MEVCKTSTLHLKVLNKHNIYNMMYTEIENVILNLTNV